MNQPLNKKRNHPGRQKARILALSLALLTAVWPVASLAEFKPDRPINVISREEGSGTRGAFIELFNIEVKGEDGSKKDRTTEEAQITSKTDVMLASVAGDAYAIGYVSMGSLQETVWPLAIDGVDATAENVKNGSYPVARPFLIATKAEISPVAQDFISFILSKEGQGVVAGSYIAVDENAPAFAGSRPAGKVVVAGSSSVTPIMEKLKEAYLSLNQAATIEIQMSDSTAGLAATLSGACDIGMASRALKDSEKESLTGTQIALDGIAVIVSQQNPFAALTSQQVRDIFTGDITEWEGLQE